MKNQTSKTATDLMSQLTIKEALSMSYEEGYAAASKHYVEMFSKCGENLSATMVKINCETRSKIMKDKGEL